MPRKKEGRLFGNSGHSTNSIDINHGSPIYTQNVALAGLVARGTTEIENAHYIYRGYENIREKLIALGAHIY